LSKSKTKQHTLKHSIFSRRSPIRPSSRLSIRHSSTRGRPTSTSCARSTSTITTIISPLLRLPPEVRVCIYRYILPPSTTRFKVYTDCDAAYTDRKWDVQRRLSHLPTHSQSLALLRTSRLIYHEALAVLYSENTFHFIGCNFLPVIDFIRRLSADAKGLVRQLKITMLPEARHMRADQLELFCRVVHEWLPGLNVLASDAWVWI
jgi:hypothetical protein